MSRALVITSFGTSVAEARPAITAVEEALRAAAPDYTCLRAFTSPTIRRILAARGERVPSLQEALQDLQEMGTDQVVVQPTHLLPGYEFDKLRLEAERFTFPHLTVGRPLLSDEGDIALFARRLAQDHPFKPEEAVVYMGHGTGHQANDIYGMIQAALEEIGRYDIHIGVLEGPPGLDGVLQRLERPRSVLLLPLLLAAGEHARTDMGGLWRTALKEAGHTVTCAFTGLGERGWVQQLYCRRMLEVM